MTLLDTAYKDLSLKGNNRIDFKSPIFLQVPPKLAQRRQRGRLMDKLSIHTSERRQVAERGEMQKEKEYTPQNSFSTLGAHGKCSEPLKAHQSLGPTLTMYQVVLGRAKALVVFKNFLGDST